MLSYSAADQAAPCLTEEIYDQMLDETREVASKALNRLRGLGEHLPGGVVEQIERLHQNPGRERRKTARVKDEAIPVTVRAAGLPARGTALKDHCPTGMAVVLPCPAGVGTFLRVRVSSEYGEDRWVAVEVKYCRKEGEGWVAGCELLGNQPPI